MAADGARGARAQDPSPVVLEFAVAVTATDEKNTLSAPLRAIAAVPVEDTRFEFNSSFLLPDAARSFQRLSSLHDSHPDAPVTLFGHADRVGDEGQNKKLSGRRARAVYATLVRDTDTWEELYSNPLGGDNWQGRPPQYMLLKLGFDPGSVDGNLGKKTRKAVQDFQSWKGLPTTGNLNPSTRQALFAAYMDAICTRPNEQPFRLEPADFLGQGKDPDGKADYQGCSEFNPIFVLSKRQDQELRAPDRKSQRDFVNAPNRRVTIFFIDPASAVTPDEWPCPRVGEGVSACRKRFWSDGSQRIAPTDETRRAEDTHDTYGCRFYERLTLTAEPAPLGGVRPGEVRARWSKPQVKAVHNSTFPPATPPTDAIPDDAKVELLVDTQGIPDGTPARIEILHAQSGTVVSKGELDELEVRGDQVVSPDTGARPEWSFTAEQGPWEVWDKPLFCIVAHVGDDMRGESPRDLDTEEDLLRVEPVLVTICDLVADTPQGGSLTTRDEAYEIGNIQKLDPSNGVYVARFNQLAVPTALWGSVLRNSYGYHQTSHGDVRCRVDGAQFKYNNDLATVCPRDPAHAGRSVIYIGDTALGDAETSDAAAVPSVPRYLVYLNTCSAGWEPSLANAFLARGTRNVIAFRKSIGDDEAREMARQFYRKWTGTFRCDPEKIQEVYLAVSAPYATSMQPRLFGPGAGAPAGSPTAAAAGAVLGAFA